MDGPTTASDLGVRVLTLNAHKGFTFLNRRFVLHELREAIQEVGADLVFLQEVLGSHELHSIRHQNWPTVPQYEFLADQVWSAFAYGRNAVYPAGHHGNALLSKFPIVEHHNHDVSIGAREERGLLHCRVSLPNPGRELHAICVHLSLYERDRTHQMERLCRLVEERIPPAAPLIVAGDFNDWRSRAHAPLARNAGLAEVFVAGEGRAARSFPARWPLLPLDRIYVRNLRIGPPHVHRGRPWSHLSDHVALSVEVRA